MTGEPVWVSRAVVLALHDEQLAEHGGAVGVRDETLLDSALTRPQQLFHYRQLSIVDLAACYAFGLARNHAFVDGNKRSSLVTAELFLGLNGFILAADDAELVVTWLSLAAGEIDEGQLSEWLQPRIVAG